LNPNAIAIDLDYGTGWTHVGYIASEHADIIDVFVQHIKDMVDFLRMEFYPKIWIDL
jgi:hypothetical protein